MTRFFTSDTHFGHQNIIKFCDRPFSDVPHMNEMLIKNWNDTVGPYDEVFHLGDVALGPWVEWNNSLSRLNGRVYLIKGNHDRIFKGMGPKQNDKFAPVYDQWFAETYDFLGLGIEGAGIVNLSHFPYDGDSHDEDRYTEYRLEDTGRILIHGHTHLNQIVSRSNKGTLQIHVGVDAWDYRPVPESEVLRLIQENS